MKRVDQSEKASVVLTFDLLFHLKTHGPQEDCISLQRLPSPGAFVLLTFDASKDFRVRMYSWPPLPLPEVLCFQFRFAMTISGLVLRGTED